MRTAVQQCIAFMSLLSLLCSHLELHREGVAPGDDLVRRPSRQDGSRALHMHFLDRILLFRCCCCCSCLFVDGLREPPLQQNNTPLRSFREVNDFANSPLTIPTPRNDRKTPLPPVQLQHLAAAAVLLRKQ